MNTFIALETLHKTNLHDFHEVWLTCEESYPQDPSLEHSVCLWRVDRVLTRDVSIDDQFLQDLPCLWLRIDDLQDQKAIGVVEHALKTRLEQLELSGQFYPPDLKDSAGGGDARDLRS